MCWEFIERGWSQLEELKAKRRMSSVEKRFIMVVVISIYLTQPFGAKKKCCGLNIKLKRTLLLVSLFYIGCDDHAHDSGSFGNIEMLISSVGIWSFT